MFSKYGEVANYIQNIVSKYGGMRILEGQKLTGGQNGFPE